MTRQYTTDDVTVVTTHFNPMLFERTRKTYYEWLPRLPEHIADRVICYEAVFDEDPPEIEGSIKIQASRDRHLMWQKESMLQIALEQCTTPLFCWIDHDIYYKPKSFDWLSQGIAAIGPRIKAVQLFRRFHHYDSDGTLVAKRSMIVGGWSPGGNWLAEAQFLRDAGGFPRDMIVGSGDAELFHRIRSRSTCIDATAHHIWHGDRANRRYTERHDMLDQHGFDPSTDVGVDDNGLSYWTSDKPAMHAAVADYFAGRLEDGVEVTT